MDKPSEGWILYHRNSIRHHLRSKPLIWNYWMHCIEEAAYADHIIWWDSEEFDLKRGSFVMTIEKEKVKLGMTTTQIRTSRRRLIGCNMIRTQTSRKGSLITVCKYDYWQDWKKVRDIMTDRYSADNLTDNRHKGDTKVTQERQQHNKGNKGNKENNIKSADARMSKDEMKQAEAKKRGCSDPSFYSQIIKSKCSKAIEEGNLSLDDITASWTSGIHYNDVIELFKD
jgi:hypothetical protein